MEVGDVCSIVSKIDAHLGKGGQPVDYLGMDVELLVLEHKGLSVRPP